MIQIYVLMQYRLQWNEIIAFRIPVRETEVFGLHWNPNTKHYDFQFTDFDSSG